jgi:mRNA-degrading endonuclease RelE of RelBE toxin-antitoxin system
MDRTEKALAKLFSKKQADSLDIKKLKGRDDIFRVRKGDIRIMYRFEKEKIFLLSIERRNDNTYK